MSRLSRFGKPPYPPGLWPQFLALLAIKEVRDIGLLYLSTGEVDPCPAQAALNHGPPCKGLSAVTRDQVP
jgi:hypothetical protein